MKKSEQTEHQSRFEKCMRDAGYVAKNAVSYSALAQDIILNLPADAHISTKADEDEATFKARKKCMATIRDLALGNISPIYADPQRSGKMRHLAIEVAALLNVPVEHLFEFSLATVSLDHQNDYGAYPQSDAKAGHDHDGGLVARDILKLRDALNEEERELFVAYYIEGLNSSELMKKFECTGARLAIKLERMNLRLKNFTKNDDFLTDYTTDAAEYFYGYDPRPETVSLSNSHTLAGEFYRVSFRASFQRDNPAVQESVVKARNAFLTFSLRMKPEGEQLIDCTPQELVQVLEAFSIARDKPSARVINAWKNTFVDLQKSYTAIKMQDYFMSAHVRKSLETVELIKSRLSADFKGGNLPAYQDSDVTEFAIRENNALLQACDNLSMALK